MPRKPKANAHTRAVSKYNKQNVRQFLLKFNIKTDADIIAVLDGIEGSKQDYIRTLIRADIEKNP